MPGPMMTKVLPEGRGEGRALIEPQTTRARGNRLSVARRGSGDHLGNKLIALRTGIRLSFTFVPPPPSTQWQADHSTAPSPVSARGWLVPSFPPRSCATYMNGVASTLTA